MTSNQNLVRMEVSGLNTAASLDVSGVLTAWKCDPVTRKPISSPAAVGGVFAKHYGREVSAGDRKELSISFMQRVILMNSLLDLNFMLTGGLIFFEQITWSCWEHMLRREFREYSALEHQIHTVR